MPKSHKKGSFLFLSIWFYVTLLLTVSHWQSPLEWQTYSDFLFSAFLLHFFTIIQQNPFAIRFGWGWGWRLNSVIECLPNMGKSVGSSTSNHTHTHTYMQRESLMHSRAHTQRIGWIILALLEKLQVLTNYMVSQEMVLSQALFVLSSPH